MHTSHDTGPGDAAEAAHARPVCNALCTDAETTAHAAERQAQLHELLKSS